MRIMGGVHIHLTPALVCEVKAEIEQKIVSGELTFLLAQRTCGPRLQVSRTSPSPATLSIVVGSYKPCVFRHTKCLKITRQLTFRKHLLTLDQWKLAESRLVAINTDSGSNVKLACQLLGWRRLSCFRHNLNLAVSKGLDDVCVKRLIGLCKSDNLLPPFPEVGKSSMT